MSLEFTCFLFLATLSLPCVLASALAPAQSRAEQPSSWVRSASCVVTPITSWPGQLRRKLALVRRSVLTSVIRG